MPKMMDQRLFTAGAISLAATFGDENPDKFELSITFLAAECRSGYASDTLFEAQWREVSPRLWHLTANAHADSKMRQNILIHLSSVARLYDPTGKPIKKFLGIFGGHFFRPSHPSPADRVDQCIRDFVMYYTHWIQKIEWKLTVDSVKP